MTDPGASGDRNRPPPVPRWVKLLVLLGVVLLLLVGVLLAGGHGPAGHAPGMLVGIAGAGGAAGRPTGCCGGNACRA